jgi:erythromycin esterase-like protein
VCDLLSAGPHRSARAAVSTARAGRPRRATAGGTAPSASSTTRRANARYYVPTDLPARYDALLHLDRTQALHPLHVRPRQEAGPPETYPWGL